SALPLLVPWVLRADDHDPAATPNDLALVADPLHGRPNLHLPAVPSISSELPVPVHDPPPGQVIGGELHQHPVAREDPDVVHAHLSRDVRQDPVSIVQLEPEHGVRKGLDYCPFDLDRILLRQAPGVPLDMPKDAPAALERTASIGAHQQSVYVRETGRSGVGDQARVRAVRTSGPSSVTAMLCSKWAERLLSAVATV